MHLFEISINIIHAVFITLYDVGREDTFNLYRQYMHMCNSNINRNTNNIHF